MSENHIRPWRNIYRRKSRQIHVGNVPIGGDAPIAVQTMTNTLTTDTKSTIEQIFAKCESLSITGNEFLNAQFEELKHKSPTSLKISLKQIRDASKMTLKDELIMEYRMVQRCLEIGDFFEGVRAMLVDKDRKPNWKPSDLNKVDEIWVNHFFEPLHEKDLKI